MYHKTLIFLLLLTFAIKTRDSEITARIVFKIKIPYYRIKAGIKLNKNHLFLKNIDKRN
jgi:hypothetical protein